MHRGYSIIEVALYVGFVALLSVALVQLLLISHNQEIATESSQLIRGMAVDIFEELQETIGAADDITVPTKGNESTVLTLIIDGETISYTTTNGAIVRQVETEAPESLTPESLVVTNFFVGNYTDSNAADGVTISFNASGTPFKASFIRHTE